MSISPRKLYLALHSLNMSKLKKKAAEIIAENVRNLDGVGTHSPYTMSQKWDSLFDDVKSGAVTVSLSDVESSRWDPKDAFFEDDTYETRMLSNILQGNKVELSSAEFIRERRFVMGKKGAYMIKDPHAIDYVLCHVKGYRKYEVNSKFVQYVKGRDVIISGTLLAITEIIDMMKKEIEDLIKRFR